jgi:hypothetical protein
MCRFQFEKSGTHQYLKHFSRKKSNKWNIKDFRQDILQKSGAVPLKSVQLNSLSVRESDFFEPPSENCEVTCEQHLKKS